MRHTTAIEIDLDVHRALEARRETFDQSHNDILRELFDIQSIEPRSPHLEPPKPSRRTGRYVFVLRGEAIEEGSLKAAYMSCLRRITKLEPRTLDRLAMKTTRARRIVSRDPRALYLKKPELADKYAEPLVDHWWVDINLSGLQCEHRLKMACDVAGLAFGTDLILRFPN